MEAVEDQTEIRMIEGIDQPPRMFVRIDVPPPGERFITRSDTFGAREFGKLPELVDE